MVDRDEADKIDFCQALLTEGIESLSDTDAVIRLGVLTDLAVELRYQEGLAGAIAWHETLQMRGLSEPLAILIDYNRANAIAGTRYATQWTWDQPTLASEIFFLRRAISRPAFRSLPVRLKSIVLNNLGNRLAVAGRIVEALGYWHRVLQTEPKFGMSLCNRAIHLTHYANALPDPGKRVLLLWMAHNEATAALAPDAIYTDLKDKKTRDRVVELKNYIELEVDIRAMSKERPLEWERPYADDEEKAYRSWSLANCLYVNPANDLSRCAQRATIDSLGLPPHIISMDAPDTFNSFFNQMKQEYVSARWMLYEALMRSPPHFSDKDVPIEKTIPLPAVSLAVEKTKAAYRISYSLFDKMAFFLNAYMQLGIEDKEVSFRRLWRTGAHKPIRPQFDQAGNWPFCALFWVARDFYEKETDEVAEPEARHLSEIRNHLEHRYLRITVDEESEVPADDLALSVPRPEFEAKALHLLSLARSALIYLALGVAAEEGRRETLLGDGDVGEIPPSPEIPFREKT